MPHFPTLDDLKDDLEVLDFDRNGPVPSLRELSQRHRKFAKELHPDPGMFGSDQRNTRKGRDFQQKRDAYTRLVENFARLQQLSKEESEGTSHPEAEPNDASEADGSSIWDHVSDEPPRPPPTSNYTPRPPPQPSSNPTRSTASPSRPPRQLSRQGSIAAPMVRSFMMIVGIGLLATIAGVGWFAATKNGPGLSMLAGIAVATASPALLISWLFDSVSWRQGREDFAVLHWPKWHYRLVFSSAIVSAIIAFAVEHPKPDQRSFWLVAPVVMCVVHLFCLMARWQTGDEIDIV